MRTEIKSTRSPAHGGQAAKEQQGCRATDANVARKGGKAASSTTSLKERSGGEKKQAEGKEGWELLL